jgi:phenylacetic acid degradation protein paaN
MYELFDKHRETFEAARKAVAERGYWSPYPEVPSGKIYGETAKTDGEQAFKNQLRERFEIDQPGTGQMIGTEVSPYGFELGVTYPQLDVEQGLAAAEGAQEAWSDADVATRTGICLEILDRLNKRSFEIAHAVMHTTGQAFMMAFQAGGPHAQDRGLEAVVQAYNEMSHVPERARWEKPQGKQPPLVLEKSFRIVPRGTALLVGCSTFPNWNGYPGFFASLATGNALLVKPHPGAILPLALSVRIAREVLSEAGFDPNLVLLAPDTAEAPIAKDLATRPQIGVIDFTGSSSFGDWLEQNATQASVYTEKAGVNSVVVDSTDNFKGMTRNLAFSLSLYSGQMCTAPQDIFVPKDGIETDQGHKTFDEVAEGIATALDKLHADQDRANAILGAIQNPATWERVDAAAKLGEVVHGSAPVDNPAYPQARVRTPLLIKVDESADTYRQELFGPIGVLVAAADTDHAIKRAAGLAQEKGAITALIYSTSERVLRKAEKAFARAGVSLAENFTADIHVNQSAAFSDYHVSGRNPAGNACLTDSAFVAGRFHVVATRVPAAA